MFDLPLGEVDRDDYDGRHHGFSYRHNEKKKASGKSKNRPPQLEYGLSMSSCDEDLAKDGLKKTGKLPEHQDLQEFDPALAVDMQEKFDVYGMAMPVQKK